MTLTDARRALEAGRVEEAIPLLLEAWRAVRDPRLAVILDTLSGRITRDALSAPSHKKLVEQFVALVRGGDPLDQPRLAAVIGTTRSAQMVEQLESLLELWPADPRFTVPLVELLKRPPFTGSGTQSAWRRLFKVLQAYADPRLLDLLPALDFPQLLREQTGSQTGAVDNAFSAGFFTERCAALVAALARKYAGGVPRFAPAQADELARIGALAGTSLEAALVAEVLADPDDAAAKEVLGDHLLEQGDPRGRFLALQRARAAGTLSPTDAREERALIAAHGVRWVGALAALVDPHTMRFEDGFLAWCGIDSDRVGLVETLTGNPGWATVRHIYLAGNAFPHQLLAHPVMRSLTSVSGIRDGVSEAVLSGPHVYPWTRVGLDPPVERERLAEQLQRVFPAVTELYLRAYRIDPTAFEFLWTPEFARLTTIGIVSAPVTSIPAFLVALARAPATTTIEFCEYHHLGYMVRLTGTGLELRRRAAWGRRKTYGELVAALAARAGTFTRIRLYDRA
ncbi:MAG: hypothetical protein NT062_24705, partial [Proteobacteria bacterium]|nr:hypothetical protein [Pseudomonadota bacterium]